MITARGVTVVYILAISFVLVSRVVYAGGWYIDYIDSPNEIDHSNTSISLDLDDNPYIFYYNSTEDSNFLKSAHYNGNIWIIDIIKSGICQNPSSIIDETGNVHVAYSYTNPHKSNLHPYRLEYAYLGSSDWEISTIFNGLGGHPSLVLDSDGNPCIAHTSGYDIYYTYYDGSDWIHSIVDSGKGCSLRDNSLALDGNGYPNILYISYDWSTNKTALKLARYNGSDWEIGIVDERAENSGAKTSIVFDKSGNTHIAYSDIYPIGLTYAVWDGKQWSFDYLEAPGASPSLVLDSDDNPILASRQRFGGGNNLYYSTRRNNSWQIKVLDSYGDVGYSISFDISPSDIPHISYKGFHYLKYATYRNDDVYFNLLGPPNMHTLPDPITFVWEEYYASPTNYKSILYDLWFSEYPDFSGANVIYDISEPTYTFPESTFEDTQSYYWKVRAKDGPNSYWCNQGFWQFTIGDIFSKIDPDATPFIPTAFSLSSAYPNPSSGSATITFALPQPCDVNLDVFDIKGRKVTTLAKGEYAAGEYETEVNNLSSGIYLYRLRAGEFSDTKKMIVR